MPGPEFSFSVILKGPAKGLGGNIPPEGHKGPGPFGQVAPTPLKQLLTALHQPALHHGRHGPYRAAGRACGSLKEIDGLVEVRFSS